MSDELGGSGKIIPLCLVCNKEYAASKCEKCSWIFCQEHVNSHLCQEQDRQVHSKK